MLGEKSALESRFRLREPLVYSAGSLTALFAVFAVILTASVSLWFWLFAFGNPLITGLDTVYAPFVFYAFLVVLGYGCSRLFFGRTVLRFINSKKESEVSLVACAVFVVFAVIGYLRFGISFESMFLWLNFITITIVAPVAEEVFYRLFFLSTLVKATQQPLLSIILNSLIFTLAHLSVVGGPSLELLFGALLFSIVVGFVFLYTRNLSVAIGLHFAFNIVGVFLTSLL
jgi:membrane protease YdiL (CAAX protease family)